MLTKISQSVSLIISRGLQTMVEKTELHQAKALRSRQRITFERMISTLPELLSTIFRLLCLIQETVCHLSLANEHYINWKTTFKSILKLSEKLSSQVRSQKNKWDEVESLVTELKRVLEIFEIEKFN